MFCYLYGCLTKVLCALALSGVYYSAVARRKLETIPNLAATIRRGEGEGGEGGGGGERKEGRKRKKKREKNKDRKEERKKASQCSMFSLLSPCSIQI